MRTMLGLIVVATACCLSATAADKPRLREPIGIVVSPRGGRLYIANRHSGTVSIIDVEKKTVVKEIAVGGRLSDIVATPNGKWLLVTDETKHRLYVLRRSKDSVETIGQCKVPLYPVDVVVTADGKRCFITSLWSRSVSVVELAADGKPRVSKTIQIGFEPRRLCLAMQDTRLIVADSFGGSLAILDARTLKTLAVKKVPGHNIRGLTLSANGKRLYLTLQSLNRNARSTFDDVHWGNMLVNVFYSFAIRDVCDPKADLLNDRRMTHLGAPENAAGDPGAIAVAKGRVAVALSGVHEVAVAKGLTDPLARVQVGKRPTALAMSSDGKRVFSVDTFSDSITIVDAVKARKIATISLGKQPKLTAAQLGERLFFDAKLSHDDWMSCHSCHTDGHTNGLLNDNLSDGSFGAPKRVLSLLGVGETRPWAWKGHIKSLEEQTRNSITKTMRGEKADDKQVKAIVAFMKTLKPAPTLASLDAKPDKPAISAGHKLFTRLNCNRCHTAPTYTSNATYDVGLKDTVGNRRYNPPSLRGVARRRLLFHDGRAKSLEGVFVKYRHQLPKGITRKEIDLLLAFLRSV